MSVGCTLLHSKLGKALLSGRVWPSQAKLAPLPEGLRPPVGPQCLCNLLQGCSAKTDALTGMRVAGTCQC